MGKCKYKAPKNLAPEKRLRGDEMSGHKIALLVEVDGFWFQVPNAIEAPDSYGLRYGWTVRRWAVEQTVRDVGPIPAPREWRPA